MLNATILFMTQSLLLELIASFLLHVAEENEFQGSWK